jgi:anti-sigma regulatory factor (Ser/Thr protein kinase)
MKATAPMNSSPVKLELKITSDPANLQPVRKQVETFAESAGLSRRECDGVGLAVNEAMANIIRHGYGNATDQPIHVTAEVKDDQLFVQIRDWGKPFDPQLLPRDIRPELRPGGLGLLCMRKLMDSTEFVTLSDGMLLKMVKRITKS